MKTNTVHLLGLYRYLSGDLTFDVWNDDAIPVESPTVKTTQDANNAVYLLRLYRYFSGDLAFDVRNDDAIPVEFPNG